MSDYRVEVKVRNNNLLKMIESRGYKSVGQFCRKNNHMNWASTIGEFVNLKRSPLDEKRGGFLKVILDICEVLECSPEDLFSDTQLVTALESNKRSMQVGEAEMLFMLNREHDALGLDEHLDLQRLPGKIDQLLESLTPREAKVISMRFGLNDYGHIHTLPEVGKEMGCTRERIRQIEAKALRKLRHPRRHSLVLDYVEVD